MRRNAMYRTTKETWMADFQSKAVKAGLFEPGRVCWDTATFFYNECMTAEKAVKQMLRNREVKNDG